MSAPFPYIIRQGDHLRRVAHRHGVTADAVWDHPANAGLRAKRGNGDELLPGDLVYVPNIPGPVHDVITGTEARFVANIEYVDIDVVFEDLEQVFRNCACQIIGIPGTGEQGIATTSDDQGRVTFSVPAYIDTVTVRFPERKVSCDLLVGHMDPRDELIGVAKRLASLGYLHKSRTSSAIELHQALVHFQRKEGLEATGNLDDKTRSRLETRFSGG